MSKKTKTKELQEIADQKFTKGYLVITFEAFTGFYASTGFEKFFLGDYFEAKEKLEKRSL